MSVLLRNKIPFSPNRPFLGPFLLQGLFSFMHVAWLIGMTFSNFQITFHKLEFVFPP